MKVYCIGIGGIGLSALARYYRHKGYEVLGSDAQESSIIESLKKEGCDIITGEDASRVTEDIHIVVYTIAISADQSELTKAKSLGLRCLTYPEALGEITQEKTTIAVSGTHGKTTTTAMVYSALKACGVSPTVIVGSLLAEHGTNFVPGDSEYLVVEACEYKRSFLNLSPRHVIVTNIDADHLDYYKDINDIKEAFASFAEKVKEGGLVVTHDDVQLAVRGEHLVTKREEVGNVT
jgi:UDP-N-acetylmuramate--alanine ligase